MFQRLVDFVKAYTEQRAFILQIKKSISKKKCFTPH